MKGKTVTRRHILSWSFPINLFFLLMGCSMLEPARPSVSLYTNVEIDYFREIASGSEFGSSDLRVRKWNSEIRIQVHGSPTEVDRRTLNQVIKGIKALAKNITLGLSNDDPNLDIYFVPESEFTSIEPNYVPGNLGFFWTWWNDSDEIYEARVLISTTGLTQQERSHLIREELTQSLGLMTDSESYPESIFYQRWTTATEYAPIDERVIEMLYRQEVYPGMRAERVVRVLRTLSSPEVTGRHNKRVVPDPRNVGPVNPGVSAYGDRQFLVTTATEAM